MESLRTNPKRRNGATTERLPVTGIALLLVAMPACRSRNHLPDYRNGVDLTERNVAEAARLNDAGLRLVSQGRYKEAEEAFRTSLQHDLYYAPAHNNLGLALLHQDRHYDAAWEFDFARKIAPGAGEPRANLGRLYEQLGRLEPAIDEYEKALELSPKDLDTMRSLARVYVKAGRRDRSLKNLLEKLLHIPGDHQWDAWARGQLIRLGRADHEVSGALSPPDSGE